VVNPVEADVVKTLFSLYAELGNLRRVEVEAEKLGLRPKAGLSPSGHVRGGSPFSRGQLHHLLTNPVYIGRIRHKDQSYPGQHPAIIDNALWQEVQTKLIAASARPRGSSDTAIEARISPRAARPPTEAARVPSRSDPTG
jgi:hypothetical protein